MANRSRFQIALPNIIDFFDKNSSKVFSHQDLKDIFYEKNSDWNLPNYMYFEIFLRELLEYTSLKRADLNFTKVKSKRLYSFDDNSSLDLAANLYPKGYLSHKTALYLNNLSDVYGTREVYVTNEQSTKHGTDRTLEQVDIDNAFSKPPRISQEVTTIDNIKITLLRGKGTNNLGVTTMPKSGIRFTDLERTMIDIVVRPFYSGGVIEVLNAFKKTKAVHLSINTLYNYLEQMDFIYPYFQAVGFYLDYCGVYNDLQLSLFRKQIRKYDFYLDYNMKNPKYSKEWRIFYPANL